jgi:hypothetical protein
MLDIVGFTGAKAATPHRRGILVVFRVDDPLPPKGTFFRRGIEVVQGQVQ